MLLLSSLATCLLGSIASVRAAKYTEAMVPWNMNTNQTATEVLDYSGEWENHTFHPSPSNWRFPVYTIILDKWINGNPSNDNANDTVFEFDFYETGLRNGGDIQGLYDSLDYLQGMGVRVSHVGVVCAYPNGISVFMFPEHHIKTNLIKPISIPPSTIRPWTPMAAPSQSGEKSSPKCMLEICTSCST